MFTFDRAVFLILAVLSCAPVVSNALDSSTATQPVLSFVKTTLDESREGYFTLEWNPVEGAVYYRVEDSTGRECYQGVATESFQSGLSDGTYAYRVQAFDDQDAVLATSGEAAVTVRHWGMLQTLVLFTIGLIVVVGIALVIVRGESISRRIGLDGESAKPEFQSPRGPSSSGSGEIQ